MTVTSSPPPKKNILSFFYRLCSQCGVKIDPNPANMCVACLRTQVDITDRIPKRGPSPQLKKKDPKLQNFSIFADYAASVVYRLNQIQPTCAWHVCGHRLISLTEYPRPEHCTSARDARGTVS